MMNFFTKLLTPVFIALGMVNPTPVVETPIPDIQVQQELIELRQKVQEFETEKAKAISEDVTINIKTEPTPEKEVVVAKPKTKPKPNPVVIPIVKTVATCGTSHESKVSLEPIENLCIYGTPSLVEKEESIYTWTCILGEEKEECSAVIEINGQCNTSKSVLGSNYSSSDICITGVANSRLINGVLNWVCEGVGSGEDSPECTALVTQDGSCGSSTGSCTKGSSFDLLDDGLITTWKCMGMNGGNTKSCSYTKPRNGECGRYSLGRASCDFGEVKNVAKNKDVTTWQCVSLEGGNTTPCSYGGIYYGP